MRALGLGPLLGLACAVGAEPGSPTTFGPGPASGMPPATAGEDSLGEDSVGDETFDSDTSPWPPSDTTGGDDDETTGGGDDTTSGMPDDTTGDDGGPAGNCADPGTCQTAGSIGTVSGDQGSPSLGHSGTDPTWLRFRVTEDDDSLVGAPLSFTVTLQSPAGADFDLYVHRGMEGGTTGCNGFQQQSTNAGPQDAVAMTWGEGLVPNGLDDSAWVAVEIRAKDDLCAPPQEWTLTVLGNT